MVCVEFVFLVYKPAKKFIGTRRLPQISILCAPDHQFGECLLLPGVRMEYIYLLRLVRNWGLVLLLVALKYSYAIMIVAVTIMIL